MKRFLPCIFLVASLFLLPLCLFAQVIIGCVVDSGSRPLAFVTVVLMKNGRYSNGTSTDEKGHFKLTLPHEKETTCALLFSLVGYKKLTRILQLIDSNQIQQFILIKDESNLAELTILAKKPLLTRKADRFIVNVESSILASSGSGMDVLQRSPGLWVNNDGGIRIKGNQPVTVMINNVILRMSEEDLATYLSNLRSEDISKIEIIPNPPAEYEASGPGGIVHILLKRSAKHGLSGTATAQYRQQGKKSYTGSGISATWKLKDLYIGVVANLSTDIKLFSEKTSIDYADGSFSRTYTSRDERTKRQQYNYSVNYDLSKKQSLALAGSITDIHSIQYYTSDLLYSNATQHSRGIGITSRDRKPQFGSLTFNYVLKTDPIGSMLQLIADYSGSSKKENMGYDFMYVDSSKNSFYRLNTPNDVTIYSVQLDYIKFMQNKIQLTAGSKFALINRDNNLEREDLNAGNWIFNRSISNHFAYTEKLLMGHLSAQKSYSKTMIKPGIRIEVTNANGHVINTGQQFRRNYLSLFPSVFITRTLNENKGTSLSLSYSRRIERPALNNLNPYRVEFSNNTAVTGSPELLPQYSHNIGLDLQFFKNFVAGIYFTKTTNLISLLAAAGANNFIDYRSQNLGSSLEIGSSLSAPFNITNSWSVNNTLSFFHQSYRTPEAFIINNTFTAKSIHSITIGKRTTAECTFFYRSPCTYSNYRNSYSFYMDAGVSRKIAHNKARLKLYLADVFNSLNEKELTISNGTFIDFYRKRPTRTLSLLFTWNFSSGKKFSEKKISQSNNEEKNRAG